MSQEHTETNGKIRAATRKDSARILTFIRQLAEYEKLLDAVTATESMIEESIFDKHAAEVVFVMEDDKEVGFALFFQTYSTFLAKPGMHLEDLFVLPEHRGKGYGKALLRHLAGIALEREYGRLEWSCLDWNTSSIEFYLSLGAEPMDDWTTYRVTGKSLEHLANSP